jgi:hypothetical protein
MKHNASILLVILVMHMSDAFARRKGLGFGVRLLFLLGRAYYTQQGCAHIRRPHPNQAARPALMRRAAHAVESKAVVRIEVAVTPRPCLGCVVELVLRVGAPLRRDVPPR